MSVGKVKDYTLYRTLGGFTPKSWWYGRVSREIFTVRAVSVKQALFFAYRDYISDDGKLGITGIEIGVD